MDTIQLFAGLLAVILSFLAIFINQWITLMPWLSINFQYRRKIVQILIAAAALTITISLAYFSRTPRNITFLILTILLTPLSGFNYAKKFLVPLTDPKHETISKIDWPEDQLVLGHVSESGQAIAWTLDLLRPHHLINDWIEDKSILAGW